MQVWNVLHAARWKYRTQKIAISAPSHNFVGIAVSSQLRHVSPIGKKTLLLSSNSSATCSDYNYGEHRPTNGRDRFGSSGTPPNFNGFRVLAALLHGTLVVGVSQTVLRWTQGATYIRQGGHQVGHWHTFSLWLLCTYSPVVLWHWCLILRDDFTLVAVMKQMIYLIRHSCAVINGIWTDSVRYDVIV